MHVLSIDIGSYSVKYAVSNVEKKRATHLDVSEIVIKDYVDNRPDMPLQEAQISIVQEIINDHARPDTKIVFQCENEMLTTRILNLPGKSKKQAELALPFQLEEDIPYTLSEVHYAYRLEPAKNNNYALTEIVKSDVFENFYQLLQSKNALPSVLTCEASVVENYFNQNTVAGAFCVLDIGHKTTKAYFFYNSRLIVTHVSYMGGHDVNEMISQTYKINNEDAITYKHQNAFLLTSSQMNEVDSAQKEFGVAMEKVFHTLVTDFTRWKIGFKVNYGRSLAHVFLCGGSSNIKNIANYLTEKWDTKVVLLETFDQVESNRVDLGAINKSRFALVNMMSIGMRRKNRFVNLLNGKFAQASGAELPLHSFAFIGVRVAFVTLLLFISLIAESIYLRNDISQVNAFLLSYFKSNSTEVPLTAREKRALALQPKVIADSINKLQRNVKQEISTLQSSIEIKALPPLLTVSQAANATKATLIEFKSDETNEVTATFSSESLEELNALKGYLESSPMADVKVQVNEEKLQLTMTGTNR